MCVNGNFVCSVNEAINMCIGASVVCWGGGGQSDYKNSTLKIYTG